MSEENKKPSVAESRQKLSPREAREAAAEASGFLASITIRAGDEDFEVPQRGLLDDDQREALNQLEIEAETWDREEDTVYPARVIRDENGSETHWPERTEKGALKLPYRLNGQLISPSYPVRVAIALWGQEKYDRYKSFGGRASDVTATLTRLDHIIKKREQGDGDTPADPKSRGGDD